MQLTVDPDYCQGHLRCQAAAPDLFDSDEQGYAVVVPQGELTANEVNAAKAAIRACPEAAIRLTGA